MIALIGQKRNMTQLYTDDGVVVPVTEIHVGECVVVRKRTMKTDGYEALQIGYGRTSKRKSNKAMAGHCRKVGVEPCQVLREIKVDKLDDFKVGDKLAASVFNPGDKVRVTGITRGRGFTGGMKRWGWHGGPASHGSMFSRRIGSLGSGTTPGRPLKGRTMPGHYGVEQVTIKNLKIFRVEPERGTLYVTGSVPGHHGSIVLVRKQA
jgi:large subunit ribosomal protein L3